MKFPADWAIVRIVPTGQKGKDPWTVSLSRFQHTAKLFHLALQLKGAHIHNKLKQGIQADQWTTLRTPFQDTNPENIWGGPSLYFLLYPPLISVF